MFSPFGFNFVFVFLLKSPAVGTSGWIEESRK